MHKFKAGSQVAQREFLGNRPNVVVSVLKQQHIHQKLATEFFIIWRHRLISSHSVRGIVARGEEEGCAEWYKAVGGRRAFLLSELVRSKRVGEAVGNHLSSEETKVRLVWGTVNQTLLSFFAPAPVSLLRAGAFVF
jgi:hypothetical protein